MPAFRTNANRHEAHVSPSRSARGNDAVRWYAERRDGLGDDFFAKFTATLEHIIANPEGQGLWLGSRTMRRAKLMRFPYAVLYEIHPGKIRILGLRHDKRRPEYGLDR